jgi:hypothetical protein
MAGLPLFAGGRCVNAYVTSETDSESPVADLQGIILVSFPLKGDMSRAAHFSASSDTEAAHPRDSGSVR